MSVTTMAEPQPVKEEEKPSLKLEEDCKSPPAMTPVRKDSRSPSVKDEVKAEASTPQRKGKPCPQLIGHLPRAEEEALQTFTVLTGNHYQYGTLGRSEDVFESLSCDCQYEHGVDHPSAACGDGSDCINRLTQVECIEGDCRCKAYCQNQRFQRRAYADIEVVLTEKKGYGLRAVSDIKKDAFIYEYIGDVVSQPSFAKRMREYAEEGIRHFYFMMLQKEEYIDATKRGGIGRFANHSCSPNCYVAKWTVGKKVRMGIFAKRNIQMNEELTFNYNVDRYGHEAQPCYCGESNCVGFIGGKTQTDVGAMDDLYLDALGISDEVELYGLKGNKKKKGKKLDEDYMPILKPLVEKDVPKVIQAVRQTQSRKVKLKVLTRIKLTEDQSALRQLMRLRGFSVMSNVLLEHYEKDAEMCIVVLESLKNWPLLTKNKVEDSKIEEPVRECVKSDNERLRTLAEELLAHWSSLEVGYRIPKRQRPDPDELDADAVTRAEAAKSRVERVSQERDLQAESEALKQMRAIKLKPLGMDGGSTAGQSSSAGESAKELAERRRQEEKEAERKREEVKKAKSKSLQDIIKAAALKAEEDRLAADQAAAAPPPEERKRSGKAKANKRHLTDEEKEQLKEKKLLKLVGAVVVKCMSKHRNEMDTDTFKKHAKELTQIIASKEKKSNSYQTGKLDALSEEKTAKIKKFAKDYIAKVQRKLQKAGHQPSSSSSHKPHSHVSGAGSSTPATPNADTTPDVEMDVNEALDLGDDANLDDDDGDEAETGDPSPATETQGPEPDVAVMDIDTVVDHEMMITPETAQRRDAESWEPEKAVTSQISENVFSGL